MSVLLQFSILAVLLLAIEILHGGRKILSTCLVDIREKRKLFFFYSMIWCICSDKYKDGYPKVLKYLSLDSCPKKYSGKYKMTKAVYLNKQHYCIGSFIHSAKHI